PQAAAENAAAIAEELFTVGPLEVGINTDGRMRLELRASPPENESRSLFGPEDVVLVTGGARGVTFAGVLELARRARPKRVLLGRTSTGGPEPAWLAQASDESAIKKALATHLPAASPRELGARCRDVITSRELRANLATLEQTGADCRYFSVDVTDMTA